MCGIAGIVDFTGQTPAQSQIQRMTELQRHRGPDGQGIVRRDGVALGHRRLSIIDIVGGHQPLSNETGDVWLTFNGEIYNFAALRRELISHGHVFRSQSDSEVIVHAYEQWGPDCVTRLRGMFAFGIADFRNRRLFLARDPFGIKPLFYRVEPGYVAFASELTPLLSLDSNVPPINLQAIDYFLRYRYIPAPHTGYERILRLPPAHTWSCELEGRADWPREYWQLDPDACASANNEDWLERFADVLEESVASHLVSDVPFGAFLSGGIDSTLIVASMARQLGRPVQAFSIGFDEAAYSELKYARQAAKTLGVDLHTEIVRPDVEAILDELSCRYGEPFADTSAVPTWCVSRLAREHVRMVLSGDGADEAFAGYPRYSALLRENVGRDIVDLVRRPKRALRHLAARLFHTWPDRLHRWQTRHVGVLDDAARRALWHPEFQSLVDVPCSAFTTADRRGRSLPTLRYAQHLDLKTYLPGDILTKVDIASMCHGLEVRTPFTDVRVMEFAASLPDRWRRTPARLRPATLKPLLKQTLLRHFPPDFVHRPKRGFAIPEAAWLEPDSPLRNRLDDLLDSANGRLFDLFSRAETRRLRAEFDQQGRHKTALWLLMILGIWLERRAEVAQQPSEVAS
jgi:asparagine synthase (glutamine-hydrolysing)